MSHDPEGDLQRLAESVTRAFGTVLGEARLDHIEPNAWYPGIWVVAQNTTTQVQVYFEYGTGLSVAMHRLSRDGKVRRGYGLGELLEVRADRVCGPSTNPEFDAARIDGEVVRLAEVLRTHARDILAGDFEVFSSLAVRRMFRKLSRRRRQVAVRSHKTRVERQGA